MSTSLIESLIPPLTSGTSTYVDSLSKCLGQYVEYVKNNITSDTDILRKIENINQSILSAISDLKQANLHEAYTRICKFIKDENSSIDLPIYTLNRRIPFVRLRYSESDLISRKDIFHIPFTKRYKVAQQRFSITGVPCLYLSGCAFTAWLELNKPNFSNLWCAGFRANKEIKVLDLAIRLDSILKEKNNIGKLLFYPLVLSTSYTTKYPQSPFKEEYIISNIILQAIIHNTNLKGIRYFSTKISNYQPKYSWMATNIVLPALKSCNEYDDELVSSLLLTYPQPCSTLIHSPNMGGVSCMGLLMNEIHDRDNLNNGINHFEPRIFEWYSATQFFNIDGYLRSDLAYQSIENDSENN